MKKGEAVPRPAGSRRDISISPVPLEWLDRGAWRLPSGQALIEFALSSGFLAPLLLNRKGSLRKEEPAAGKLQAPAEASGNR